MRAFTLLRPWPIGIILTLVALQLAVAGGSLANQRDQARRMHDRLVGVPPSNAMLNQMETKILAQDYVGAAMDAMTHPEFYTTQLRIFVTPWTNVEQTAFAPLNDYSATVIGIIRDDYPFTYVLTEDIVYRGANGVVPSTYSQFDNDHYIELEQGHVDLSDPALLIEDQQSNLPNAQLAPGDTAGVITTRAAGEAFFSAGTNRRMWRFTAMNYLCRDMEDLKDISRPADRVRQDVTRSPGGDSTVYLNDCVGCHSGMDPLAQAYAYFEWDEAQERVIHTPGVVQGKYLINASTFPGGYITQDNRWDNMWRDGPNQHLVWNAPASGGWGAKGLGDEVAQSHAFSVCQVEKVFQQVCFREPGNPTERAEVERIAGEFETNWNHSMKRVFAEVASYCMGN